MPTPLRKCLQKQYSAYMSNETFNGNGEKEEGERGKIIDLASKKPISEEAALQRMADTSPGTGRVTPDPAARRSMEMSVASDEAAEITAGFDNFTRLVGVLLNTKSSSRTLSRDIRAIRSTLEGKALRELLNDIPDDKREWKEKLPQCHALVEKIIETIVTEQIAGLAIKIPDNAKTAMVNYMTASGI